MVSKIRNQSKASSSRVNHREVESRPRRSSTILLPFIIWNQYAISIQFNYGGRFTHGDIIQYRGGQTKVVHNVGASLFDIQFLFDLCAEIGIEGATALYPHVANGTLRMVTHENDLKYLFLKLVQEKKDRLLTLWVGCETEDRIDLPTYEANNPMARDNETYKACLEHFSDSDYEAMSDGDADINVKVADDDVEECVEELNKEADNVREADGDAEELNEEAGNSKEGDEAQILDDSARESLASWDEDDIVEVGDDFVSDSDSDGDKEDFDKNYFHEANLNRPKFELGLRFKEKELLRLAIHAHGIAERRSVKIKKNDKRRMSAKCKDPKCLWKLYAVPIPGEKTFRIRELGEEHKCRASTKVSNVKSKWVGKELMPLWRTDPKRNMKAPREDSQAKYKVNMSMQQMYRGRKIAFKELFGDAAGQYTLLWSFIDEVKRTNPASTLLMSLQNRILLKVWITMVLLCLLPKKALPKQTQK